MLGTKNFVQQNFVKKFMTTNVKVQKHYRLKKFESKKFWVQKCLVNWQKICDKCYLGKSQRGIWNLF